MPPAVPGLFSLPMAVLEPALLQESDLSTEGQT
jgi:hypothetical protein